jgi:hypothetical protein
VFDVYALGDEVDVFGNIGDPAAYTAQGTADQNTVHSHLWAVSAREPCLQANVLHNMMQGSRFLLHAFIVIFDKGKRRSRIRVLEGVNGGLIGMLGSLHKPRYRNYRNRQHFLQNDSPFRNAGGLIANAFQINDHAQSPTTRRRFCATG